MVWSYETRLEFLRRYRFSLVCRNPLIRILTSSQNISSFLFQRETCTTSMQQYHSTPRRTLYLTSGLYTTFFTEELLKLLQRLKHIIIFSGFVSLEPAHQHLALKHPPQPHFMVQLLLVSATTTWTRKEPSGSFPPGPDSWGWTEHLETSA